MTLSEDDRLWRDQNIPNMSDEEFEKIVDTFGNGKGKAEEMKNTKIQAFETMRQQARNLFINEYKIPHIAIPMQDHLEIFQVNSNSFKNWYRMFIFERDGISLDNQIINDLCSLASAYAASPKYGSQINLNLRTALSRRFKTEWNYDLTNKNWEFIRISSNGWDILKNEIIFRRYNNQQVQVYPDKNYEPHVFDQFMKLLNTKDKDTILLLKCYIISLFIPQIQKVILILHGSQGAAKSSLQELIKMLVDPSIVKTLTLPGRLDELQQQLSHNYLVYYDNISIIKPWISDELCRAVSGSGSSKRQLYTDDDDIIRRFKRGVGMNGINLAATKPDLLSRSIIIKLEEIDDKNRFTPEELWTTFDEIKSQLLGYILDILVKVLSYEENNPDKKFKLSRMTEFAKYGEIISRCMGNTDNAFIEAYERNKEIQVDEIIEFSQVATVIMCMMFEKYDSDNDWIGTPTALYGEIKNIAENEKWSLNIDTRDKYWPKNAKSFGRRLNEIIPTLKEKGLVITRYEEPDRLRTKIIKIHKVSPETPDVAQYSNSCSNMDNFSGDISGDIVKSSGDIEKVSPENIDQNHAQNEGFGRRSTSGDIMRGSLVDASRFIKIPEYQLGDKISYVMDFAIGDLSVQNGSIGGQFRMKGEGGGRYPTPLLKAIDEIFGPEPNTIEVCSNEIPGINKGSNCFTVDIKPEYGPDLVADAQNLEGIAANAFNRWRCDPPYNEKTAKEMYNCDLPNVPKLLKEGCRVVKPGSLLFLLHEYITESNISGLKKIGFIHITAVPNRGPRVLNIYVKLPEEEISK